MEKGRKTKIITIIVLVVAIVSMSLGFAVFSNVLTISSSATVKPNAEDYVVNIYGLAEEISIDENIEFTDALTYMTSKTTSIPIMTGAFDATSAIIDNKNFTISNLNVTVSGNNQGVYYYFLVKNEGKNSVYINLDTLNQIANKTCIAKEGTTQSLVDQDCDGIEAVFGLGSSTGEEISVDASSYEIIPNDFIVFFVLIGDFSGKQSYNADGEFTVNFEDIQIEFSSIDNSQGS